MSNSLFNANSWINLQELAYDKAQAKAISPILAPAAISEIGQFAPADFLIPNWKGQGLISQDALDISKKIEKVKEQAEHRAFAASVEKYLPVNEILNCYKMGMTENWEIAEYFNLEEEFVEKAVHYWTDCKGIDFNCL